MKSQSHRPTQLSFIVSVCCFSLIYSSVELSRLVTASHSYLSTPKFSWLHIILTAGSRCLYLESADKLEELKSLLIIVLRWWFSKDGFGFVRKRHWSGGFWVEINAFYCGIIARLEKEHMQWKAGSSMKPFIFFWALIAVVIKIKTDFDEHSTLMEDVWMNVHIVWLFKQTLNSLYISARCPARTNLVISLIPEAESSSA